jgi:hypothetical protein
MIAALRWLATLPLRWLAALGLRRSLLLACLLVLAVTAYGVAQDLGLLQPPAQAAPARTPAGQPNPSRAAIADIPASYLRLYRQAGARYRIPWPLLAAIGKLESDHGRSLAPGVRTGLNRAGCCAGPMQFNLTNGPPSTWDAYGRGGSPYDPADAIPAAARKLCANGLAQPAAAARDPCPHVLGTAALHLALKRYNNACWYVHEVVTLAGRYTATVGQVLPAARDPFVLALARNPRLTTTRSHGCDPGADLASGRLDLRVTSLLAALTDRHAIRISCLHTGLTRYV